MRASADELSAWEALTVTLVVRIDKVFSIHLTNAADLCIITGMCATVGSMTVPILARDSCITWKKKLCPLDLLAPILSVCQWRF